MVAAIIIFSVLLGIYLAGCLIMFGAMVTMDETRKSIQGRSTRLVVALSWLSVGILLAAILGYLEDIYIQSSKS